MPSKKKKVSAAKKAKPTIKKKATFSPKESEPAVLPQADVTVTNSETVVVVDQAKETTDKPEAETPQMDQQTPLVNNANEAALAKEPEPEAVLENVVETPVSEDSVAIVEESNTLRWVLILIILFLVGLIGGLFYFFWFQNKPEEKQQSALKTVSVYTPSPTVDQADKGKYAIKVLNGSGTAGLAAAGKDLLKSKNYTVSSIGNADKSTYTTTEIQAKDSVSKTFLDELKTDLANNYTVDEQIGSLDSTETADVVVIIGSETK